MPRRRRSPRRRLLHSRGGLRSQDEPAAGRGLIFRIEQVTIEGNKATVTGGYYESGLSASGNVYTLERQEDGYWLVTGDELRWISSAMARPAPLG